MKYGIYVMYVKIGARRMRKTDMIYENILAVFRKTR